MIACVIGARGFVGAHVARALLARGDVVRGIFSDLGAVPAIDDAELELARADPLDRGALRRALRGGEVAFHTVDYPSSRPAERSWQLNALAPRIVVEAAAAEGLRRVVLTSSVAAVGASGDGDRIADEATIYRGGERLLYADAKHEGEVEALAAAARTGIELVVVNPAWTLGVPAARAGADVGGTRIVLDFLLGRVGAAIDGAINVVDVADVARGHLLAESRGGRGERYILGGYNVSWVELFDRLASISGERHPLLVLPREAASLARVRDELGLPARLAPEALLLMARGARHSSRKARRDLGFRPRPLDETLAETVAWCRAQIDAGAYGRRRPSLASLTGGWLTAAERIGLVAGLRAAERYSGRRLLAGA